MPDQTDIPISSFPDAESITNADKVTGLQGNANKNFTFSSILAWFVNAVKSAFVPVSRTVNGKTLDTNITLNASDVGARPSNWTPSVTDIGAQPVITANGILMGDGVGGVAAATAGTDYATPSQIPSVPSAYTSNPAMDGTASPGSSGAWAKGDHVHPSDTSRIPATEKGAANGVASLDSTGKVPSSQLPAIPTTAAGVSYDNTQSGLTADDVQEAIDELAAGAGGSTAATTSYDNTDSGLAATNAQDAIDELADEKADQTTVAPVEASATATAAHALGSIFYLDGVLYRALANIAIGGTINTGTGGNATQTKISENFKRTVTLTAAQYAQLSAAEKAADIVYIITDEPVPEISTSTPNMDGTGAAGSTGQVSDAGHTHPSDTTKANETELAYVETGSTASRAYAVGEYFCWNGLLYRSKTAISSGASFTPGTNCEQVTEGGLNRLNEPIKINRQILATSISTGLNTLQAAPTAITGYKAIGVAGVQFAAADRTKLNLVEFLLDGGQYVIVQFNSTYTKASGVSVAAFVIYAKE